MAGAGQFLWMAEMANILRAQLARGATPPRRVLPDWLVRLLAPFVPTLRTLAPLVGRKIETSNTKAQRVAGFAPRPADTLADCGSDLLDRKLVG